MEIPEPTTWLLLIAGVLPMVGRAAAEIVTPPRRAPAHYESEDTMTERSTSPFMAGFYGAIGVLFALVFVFIVLPWLFVVLVAVIGGAGSAAVDSAPAAQAPAVSGRPTSGPEWREEALRIKHEARERRLAIEASRAAEESEQPAESMAAQEAEDAETLAARMAEEQEQIEKRRAAIRRNIDQRVEDLRRAYQLD